MARKERSGLRQVFPIGEPRTPPGVILRRRMVLRQIERNQPRRGEVLVELHPFSTGATSAFEVQSSCPCGALSGDWESGRLRYCRVLGPGSKPGPYCIRTATRGRARV